MADSDGETLESWLNKATNPCNRQEDWEYIISFCDQINKELEGPQIAVRLLAHKIQSPQEWEALQALTVLEACMKNCGRRFHSEVGKFRFLNELIKVVSPKYLGERVSEKVKSKVVGLLYSWTVALPEENKIKDAYQMLKRQGIVLTDPVIPVDRTLIPSPPVRPKNPIFDDEERSKVLARLLKSKNPDDLQEANKLIKSMVKEDEVRMQRASKRVLTLEEVNNNVKLLQEMLSHYSREESSEGDKELIKELFERCESKRLTLFKMASETEDNDSSLGDILQTSDNVSRAINLYKKIVEGQDINGDLDLPEAANNNEVTESSCALPTLIDLAGFESTNPSEDPKPVPDVVEQPSALIPILPPPPVLPAQPRPRSADHTLTHMNNSLCLLDEELLHLGIDDPPSGAEKESSSSHTVLDVFQVDGKEIDFFTSRSLDPLPSTATPLLVPPVIPKTSLNSYSSPATYVTVFNTAATAVSSPAPTAGGIKLHELEVLGQQLLEEAKGASAKPSASATASSTVSALTASAQPAATGTVPSTISALTASAQPSASATASSTISALTASAQPVGSGTAPSMISALTASAKPEASGTISALTATAQSAASGTASSTLSALTVSAKPEASGTVSSTLSDLTASAASGTVSSTLSALTASAQSAASGTMPSTLSSLTASAQLAASESVSRTISALTASAQPPNPVAMASAQTFASLPAAPDSPLFLPHLQDSPQKGSSISLTNVTVPLESIRPSSLLPLTAYDQNGFRILLHFAKDCPHERPDVLVVIISMINTAPLPIRKILFQAAVPKTMKVKLQPASGTDLAAFNPIMPPASITQVMLLANPLKDKVRLRYKLSFTLGEECSSEVGEVDQFPDPDQWGQL